MCDMNTIGQRAMGAGVGGALGGVTGNPMAGVAGGRLAKKAIPNKQQVPGMAPGDTGVGSTLAPMIASTVPKADPTQPPDSSPVGGPQSTMAPENYGSSGTDANFKKYKQNNMMYRPQQYRSNFRGGMLDDFMAQDQMGQNAGY